MYKERYSRNMPLINESDMVILKNKTVAIIGLGGLGGFAAELIARVGVKKIIAVDKDTFEESNLNRQIFSNENNIGKRKTDVFLERINLINSDVKTQAYSYEFNDKNAYSILESADICIDGFDNTKGRLIAIKTCRRKGIDFIYGGINGFSGAVGVVNNNSTNSFLEFLSEGNNKKNENLGNLSFVAGIVASLQAAECIKSLLKKGNTLENKLLVIDILKNKYRVFNFSS